MNHWMTSPYEWLLTMSIDHSSCNDISWISRNLGFPVSPHRKKIINHHLAAAQLVISSQLVWTRTVPKSKGTCADLKEAFLNAIEIGKDSSKPIRSHLKSMALKSIFSHKQLSSSMILFATCSLMFEWTCDWVTVDLPSRIGMVESLRTRRT